MEMLDIEHKKVVKCPLTHTYIVIDNCFDNCTHKAKSQAPKGKLWCNYLEEREKLKKEIEEQYKKFYEGEK